MAFRQVGQQRSVRPATAYEQGEPDAGRRGEALERGEMLPGQKLGRRHHGGLAAGLDHDQCGKQGHHGLAAADVALEQAEHAGGLRHFAGDLRKHLPLTGGEREGQRPFNGATEPAIAPPGSRRAAPVACPDQSQGQLIGEQLVVGEARARQGLRPKLGFGLRMMGLLERRAPAGPALAPQQRPIEPFGKLGRSHQRRLDRAGQRLERDPGGQRINGLDGLKPGPLAGRGDVVGMGDLAFIAVVFDAPAHDAHGALRQNLVQVFRSGVEEHEVDLARLVAATHFVRPAGARRSFGRLMADDRELQSSNAPGFGLDHLGRITPVDQAARQMPQEIDHRGPGELGKRLGEPRADAGQDTRRCEEGKQDLRTHARIRGAAGRPRVRSMRPRLTEAARAGLWPSGKGRDPGLIRPRIGPSERRGQPPAARRPSHGCVHRASRRRARGPQRSTLPRRGGAGRSRPRRC